MLKKTFPKTCRINGHLQLPEAGPLLAPEEQESRLVISQPGP